VCGCMGLSGVTDSAGVAAIREHNGRCAVQVDYGIRGALHISVLRLNPDRPSDSIPAYPRLRPPGPQIQGESLTCIFLRALYCSAKNV
jgi:hypothetical protein